MQNKSYYEIKRFIISLLPHILQYIKINKSNNSCATFSFKNISFKINDTNILNYTIKCFGVELRN